MLLKSLSFWLDLLERMLATGIETGLGVLTSCAVFWIIDWPVVGGTVGIAMLTSFLKNLLVALRSDTGGAKDGDEYADSVIADAAGAERAAL